jgi:hypothetical protein
MLGGILGNCIEKRNRTSPTSFNQPLSQSETKPPRAAGHDKSLPCKIKVGEALAAYIRCLN